MGCVNGSRHFNILCGVKQGDVLSAILFNCTLDIAFESWKLQLREEGLYMHGDTERLTNTRYADDVLLYAKRLHELQLTTELLIIELKNVGLHLHADKTKILHSSTEDDDADKDYIDIDGEIVHILHDDNYHRSVSYTHLTLPTKRIV